MDMGDAPTMPSGFIDSPVKNCQSLMLPMTLRTGNTVRGFRAVGAPADALLNEGGSALLELGNALRVLLLELRLDSLHVALDVGHVPCGCNRRQSKFERPRIAFARGKETHDFLSNEVSVRRNE